MHAEEIAALLSVARSNVSTSLRELQGWGVVRVVHVLGDRRDHFESLKDVWEMFQIIVDERKRREVYPTVAVLRSCAAELQDAGAENEYTRERITNMLAFLETVTSFYEEVRKFPSGALRQLIKLKRKIRKILASPGKDHHGRND